MTELKATLRKLKKQKAPGTDGIPVDFWQTLASSDDALAVLLDLCNRCWRESGVPREWAEFSVVPIFKKGNVALPENYRPISLLQAAYKIFSSMLLQHLLGAGADKRLRQTQFGFRAGHSTARNSGERCGGHGRCSHLVEDVLIHRGRAQWR